MWRTLGTLLVKPGTLTHAYLRGRRRRYLSPLRVYLVATLTFFVLLSLVDPVGGIGLNMGGVPADSTALVRELIETYDEDIARIDRLRADGVADTISADEIERRVRAEMMTDSLLTSSMTGRLASRALDDDEREEMIGAMVEAARDSLDLPSADDEQRLRIGRGILMAMPPDSAVNVLDLRAATAQLVPEVNISINEGAGLPDWLKRSRATRELTEARSGGEAAVAFEQALRSALRQIPTVLFLLLPFYALLLKLLYVRRDWFYSEHVVFALHVHAYAFAVGSLIVLAAATGWWGTAMTSFFVAVGLSIPVYFVVAQKRVYRQSWGKTLAKSLILGPTYTLLIMTAGILLTLLLTVIRG